MARTAGAKGFTLIELLVVVSIISLLIGILLPTLGQAVKQARLTVCGTTQRGLMQGMLLWSTENRERIPGMNGTWVDAQRQPNWQQYLNSDSSAPVQSTDWMSAALKGEDLPQNRAQRFIALLNTYRCPEQTSRLPVWAGGSAGTTEAVEMVQRTGEAPYGVSYLMSAYFQWTGRNGNGQAGSFPNFTVTEYGRDWTNPVEIPRSYRSNLNQVGNPALKAGIADGFRFREASGFANTEMSYEAGADYGSFAHSTPTFNNSAEYVRARSLSYRHGGKLSAAFFDGHVGTMTEDESRSPTYWFPSGSIFNGQQAHPGAFEFYQEGDTVN
jgi:prepilin-type N-terminal cleavage/methylation domain-containing protein/prepilin-type processing-associated H-X9-DG protein